MVKNCLCSLFLVIWCPCLILSIYITWAWILRKKSWGLYCFPWKCGVIVYRIQKTTHHATLCSLEILGRLLMKLNFEGSLAGKLLHLHFILRVSPQGHGKQSSWIHLHLWQGASVPYLLKQHPVLIWYLVFWDLQGYVIWSLLVVSSQPGFRQMKVVRQGKNTVCFIEFVVCVSCQSSSSMTFSSLVQSWPSVAFVVQQCSSGIKLSWNLCRM